MKQIGTKVAGNNLGWCSVTYLNPGQFPFLSGVVSENVQHKVGLGTWSWVQGVVRDPIWWDIVWAVAGREERRLRRERLEARYFPPTGFLL